MSNITMRGSFISTTTSEPSSESDLKIRASFSGAGATPSTARQDFDSEDFVVGAGVGFKLSQRWSLRADYERLFEAGAESLDVDRFGLSAIYRL